MGLGAPRAYHPVVRKKVFLYDCSTSTLQYQGKMPSGKSIAETRMTAYRTSTFERDSWGCRSDDVTLIISNCHHHPTHEDTEKVAMELEVMERGFELLSGRSLNHVRIQAEETPCLCLRKHNLCSRSVTAQRVRGWETRRRVGLNGCLLRVQAETGHSDTHM